jgi:hypothetical protein
MDVDGPLTCPITLGPIQDTVYMTAAGQLYSAAIEAWLKGSPKDPVSNTVLWTRALLVLQPGQDLVRKCTPLSRRIVFPFYFVLAQWDGEVVSAADLRTALVILVTQFRDGQVDPTCFLWKDVMQWRTLLHRVDTLWCRDQGQDELCLGALSVAVEALLVFGQAPEMSSVLCAVVGLCWDRYIKEGAWSSHLSAPIRRLFLGGGERREGLDASFRDELAATLFTVDLFRAASARGKDLIRDIVRDIVACPPCPPCPPCPSCPPLSTVTSCINFVAKAVQLLPTQYLVDIVTKTLVAHRHRHRHQTDGLLEAVMDILNCLATSSNKDKNTAVYLWEEAGSAVTAVLEDAIPHASSTELVRQTLTFAAVTTTHVNKWAMFYPLLPVLDLVLASVHGSDLGVAMACLRVLMNMTFANGIEYVTVMDSIGDLIKARIHEAVQGGVIVDQASGKFVRKGVLYFRNLASLFSTAHEHLVLHAVTIHRVLCCRGVDVTTIMQCVWTLTLLATTETNKAYLVRYCAIVAFVSTSHMERSDVVQKCIGFLRALVANSSDDLKVEVCAFASHVREGLRRHQEESSDDLPALSLSFFHHLAASKLTRSAAAPHADFVRFTMKTRPASLSVVREGFGFLKSMKREDLFTASLSGYLKLVRNAIIRHGGDQEVAEYVLAFLNKLASKDDRVRPSLHEFLIPVQKLMARHSNAAPVFHLGRQFLRVVMTKWQRAVTAAKKLACCE